MAHGHTTFAGLFNNASSNMFLVSGTYDAFLAPFTITPGDGNPAPIAVWQLIAVSVNQHLPIALLILVDSRLMPLFLPFKQERVMGIAEHAATDSKMFAFEGEMIGTQGYLIESQDKTFNLMPRTMVPDVGTVHGNLTANLQAAAVGLSTTATQTRLRSGPGAFSPSHTSVHPCFWKMWGGSLPNIILIPPSLSSRPMVWRPLVSHSRTSAWQ
jgi:hypothetical protein